MSYANRLLPFLLLALTSAPGCGTAKQTVKHDVVLSAVPEPAARLDPMIVTLDGAPGHKLLAAGAPGKLVVRLHIGTKELPSQARPHVNLALVMDTSGSMEGKAMADAIAAGVKLLGTLEPGDRLAVISFGSAADIVVPSTILSAANMADIKAKIEAMTASGTTDMAAGLGVGINQVQAYLQSDGVNRIVLLGDGMPNDEGPILPMATAAGQAGISIAAFGLGTEYNETLMAAIAQRSGGRFHYIEESDEIASVFVDEVLRLTRTVARDMVVTLRPGPGVRVTRIVGHPSTTYAQLGTLAQGEDRDVIVELETPARKDQLAIELLDATLRFTDAVNESGGHERSVYVATHASAKGIGGEDIDVLKVAARQFLAAAVLDAVSLARQNRLPEAMAILDAAEKAARSAVKARPDAKLEEAIADLAPLRASLPSLVQQQVIQPTAQNLRLETHAPAAIPQNYQYGTPSVDTESIQPTERAGMDDVPAEAPTNVRKSHSRATMSIFGL
jgi:Ca-activated chloride channel homolog